MALLVLLGENSQKGPPNEVALPNETVLLEDTTISRRVIRNYLGNVWVIMKHVLLYSTSPSLKSLQPSKEKSFSDIIHL
jgi:hypothetical protein